MGGNFGRVWKSFGRSSGKLCIKNSGSAAPAAIILRVTTFEKTNECGGWKAEMGLRGVGGREHPPAKRDGLGGERPPCWGELWEGLEELWESSGKL
jgi:hypothetical protein